MNLITRACKKLSHCAEALLASFFYMLFYILPIDIASAFGGWLAQTIGPLFKVSKTAKINIEHAMPNLSDTEVRLLVKKMWNNLGRIIAELPHWATIREEEYHNRVECLIDEKIKNGDIPNNVRRYNVTFTTVNIR